MELTLAERLALAAVLPAEGNFMQMQVAGRFRGKLAPTDVEMDEWSIEYDQNHVSWQAGIDTTADIDVSKAEAAMAVDVLRKLDADEALTAQLVTCYEKFVEG